MSRLGKFLSLSFSNRLLVLETIILLGLARLAVVTLPFRWISCVLGQKVEDSVENEELSVPSLIVRRIEWVLRRTSLYTPWRSNCLARAIAGRFMLRRRSITSTLYFGVAKDETGEFEAHAWLSSGGKIVTGGAEANRFAVVATFID